MGGRSMNFPFRQTKKVLIVDDSRTLRAWLRAVLSLDANLEVIGEAADAFEAREMILKLRPDVITLDIEMPGMSGLEFLDRLMRNAPMPVVMLSAATTEGSNAALEALSLGAVDCLEKPIGTVSDKARRDIGKRVFAASVSRVQPPAAPMQVQHRHMSRDLGSVNAPIILIGASTGGVTALEAVLPYLDEAGPPVVVVQHMPGHFLTSFVRQLGQKLSSNVSLGRDSMDLMRGDIVFAPALGRHTELTSLGGKWRLTQRDDTEGALHCPSVDVLFKSAVPHAARVVCVLLTGLGKDGADGMFRLRKAGARSLIQNEETCVIYGMPRVAKELGAAELELPLSEIAGKINEIGLEVAVSQKRPR